MTLAGHDPRLATETPNLGEVGSIPTPVACERDRMLAFIEQAVQDKDFLEKSTIWPFNAEQLWRIWAFVESFRAQDEKPRMPPNLKEWR